MVLHNHSESTLTYKAYGKPITQLIFILIHHDELQQVQQLQETSRTGGFGSTDKNLRAIADQPGKCVFDRYLENTPTKILLDNGTDGNFISKQQATKLELHQMNLTT